MKDRLRWLVSHLRSDLGPAGWLAVVLATGSLVAWWALVRPMEADAARIEQENASLGRRAASTAVAPLPPTPREQLADFSRRFVEERAVPSSINRFISLARRQGLALEQGEFRWSSDANEPLARYTVVLPIKGGYRAIRRFSQEAVQTTPGLAIEELQLRRSDPRARTIEAQLRLVLFVRRS